MPKVASAVVLSEADRSQLETWVRAQFTPQQVALRSRILLLASAGKQDLEIASELNVNRHTPALWRKRFQTQGLEGLWEIQAGRGRKPSYDGDKVAAMVKNSAIRGRFCSSLSINNSIASTGNKGFKTLRNTQIRCRSSFGISNSSLRAPER